MRHLESLQPLARTITELAVRLNLEKTLRIPQWNYENAATLVLHFPEALDSTDISALTQTWATSLFNLLHFYSMHCRAIKRNGLDPPPTPVEASRHLRFLQL